MASNFHSTCNLGVFSKPRIRTRPEVGRVTPCAPSIEAKGSGAHGVTRPTRLLVAAITLLALSTWAAPLDLSRAKILVANPRQSTSVKAAGLLKDEIEKRTRIVLEIVEKFPKGEDPILVIGTVSELASKS